jgi:hypothetical protein
MAVSNGETGSAVMIFYLKYKNARRNTGHFLFTFYIRIAFFGRSLFLPLCTAPSIFTILG